MAIGLFAKANIFDQDLNKLPCLINYGTGAVVAAVKSLIQLHLT